MSTTIASSSSSAGSNTSSLLLLVTPWNVAVTACGYNMMLLVVNVAFYNSQAVADLNPNMFSPFGQLMVLVWGLAYLAVGWESRNNGSSSGAGAIWLVFAIEKLCYAVGWVQWMTTNNCLAIISEAWKEGGGFSTEMQAPFFHCSYGLGDATFGVLFAYLGYVALVGGQPSGRKND